MDTVNKVGNETKSQSSTSGLADVLYGNNLLYGGIISVASSLCSIIICVIVIVAFMFTMRG